MDRKKVILLVAAIIIAGLAAFMARSLLTGSAAPKAAAAAPVPTGPKVLVATRALPMGTIITAADIRYQPWPKELVEEAYLIEGKEGQLTPEKLAGYVVRNPITAGQPMSSSSLVSPDDRGFLAAVLGPGMRAISVPVSDNSSVGGFIFPGDRVDLFLSQNIETADNEELKVSETIVRNLRVLATDTQSSPTVDEKGKTVVKKFKLVTFEVTPRMAEQITVAQSLGSISLSLRPLADNAAELEQALASGALTIPKGASAEEEERIMKSVAQAPKIGGGTFSTGGDISRFRRQATGIETRGVSTTEKAREAQKAAALATQTQKSIEKIVKGPVVRVSEAGAMTEIKLNRGQ
jgi:pilus assembly protein CpaB